MLRRDLFAPLVGGAAALLLPRGVRAQAAGVTAAGVTSAGGPAMQRSPAQALKVGGNRFADMGGFVFRSLVELEADAQEVLISFENDSTTAPGIIDGVAVAPTGSADSMNSPSGAFVQLTFSGQGTGIVPPATPSPGGTVLGRLWTDTVAVQTVPRTDGGTRPLLVVSVMALTHARGQVFDLGALQRLPGCRVIAQDVGGWAYATPGLMGDAQNRLYQGVPRGDAADYMPWAMLVTQAPVGGVAVQVAGDSLSSGWMATDSLNAWLAQATAALSTPSRPVSSLVSAVAGEATLTYCANARADYALARPEVVLVSAFSPNNGQLGIAWQDAFNVACDLARDVRDAGSVPVLLAPYPWPDGSMDGAEAACRGTLQQMVTSGQGFAVFDPASVLSGGNEADPVRTLPQYLTPDVSHLNDAGVAAVAAAMTAFLGPLLPG